ncbi:3-dehydrosphinganine reductase [Coemansia sp. RSA 1813]|nr:3-dehydrosphinganine reductase [Coemansia sp. RSA 1646]KAJ1773407.1 3-dehydrosphinganine reductase [Coemansia sp. RSA 1843]KAJ2216531.1 3-dehydrosphinganine reductase [Coemansia sp. RSA 487]KAJ2571388.1 3-dehydrosphinganine reductase [Coemansia sp. RSA 1813]
MEDWHVALITIFSVLGGIAVTALANEAYLRLTAAKFDVRDKHCYVTGGSQGLGKAIAQDLARRGANVTIVARRETVLKEALADIKAVAKTKGQKIEYAMADLTSSEDSVRAISEAVDKQGAPIEYLFAVAGVSNPGMFLDQDVALLSDTMRLNYDGTLCTVHEVARRMVKDHVQGHIVLVSSMLGFFGLIGYAGYCASKFAIRGLAEALRVELQMYNINVHCYFPGTIFTPGYEAENLTKPQITKDIEGADDGLTPEQCSRGLFKGLARGEFAICTDPISMMFRCSTRGAMPNNNSVVDAFVAAIGWVALAPWRMYIDYMVKNAEPTNKPKKE